MALFETSSPVSPEDENREKRELLKDTTAFINAGGRGTRLESVLPKDAQTGITKALIDFGNEPILLYHVERLSRRGVGKIVILAGDHRAIGEVLGEKLGKYPNVEIRYEENQEGTGGDLIKAIRSGEVGKYALISNVDTLLEVDEANLVLQHSKSGAEATIALTTRKGVPNEGAFLMDDKNRVIWNEESGSGEGSERPKHFAWQGSSTGMVVLNTEILSQNAWQPGEQAVSLYSDILGEPFQRGSLYGYNNGNGFFLETGTPKSYGKMKRHPILKDILDARSLGNKQ